MFRVVDALIGELTWKSFNSDSS